MGALLHEFAIRITSTFYARPRNGKEKIMQTFANKNFIGHALDESFVVYIPTSMPGNLVSSQNENR